jgi:replicative DNA helicase
MQLENHDYEMALLGAVLIDNRVLEEFPLNEALFDNENCRMVLREINTIRARGGVADIKTVALGMAERASFVAVLSSCAPSSANAAFYYKELVELSRRRRFSSLARELSELAIGAESSDEIFRYIDESVSKIADTRQTNYALIQDYMPSVINMLSERFKNKGKLSGIPTGFPELDDKTDGWQNGNLIIIGARPGTGKTSIALNMASAAVRHNFKVGFFSAEMSAEALIMRMIADWGSANFRGMRTGRLSPSDMASIAEGGKLLAATHFFINDQPAISLDALLSDARKMKRREGVQILFIDYLSLINNRRDRTPRHEQIAEISASLKNLARELGLPVIVLSQLTRDAQGDRPNMAQLRDSGAVEQDADVIILLHNLGWADDAHTRLKLNLIVEKQRDGAIGDIPMQFVPSYMRFNEMEEPWPK